MNTNTPHTPGPWHVEWVPWGKERDLKVVAKDGGVLLTMNRTGYLLSEAVMESNAQLLAAAPDLLAALEAITRRVPILSSTEDYRAGQEHALEGCREVVLAAIAKAEGR